MFFFFFWQSETQACELPPCSLHSARLAHLILSTRQMAEHNPGIDSLPVGSPAKQNKKRQRSPCIFFRRATDAVDSLSVGAVTMAIDPDKLFPRTFWHSLWVTRSNVQTSLIPSCCTLAREFRPVFVVNVNLCVTVGNSRDLMGIKIHDSLECETLQIEENHILSVDSLYTVDVDDRYICVYWGKKIERKKGAGMIKC